MKKLFLIALIVISCVPLIDLLHPGLPITNDGKDHVARIASFYQNLQQGNFVPRWAGNLNWGYGHPVLEFLYPLPSYIASLFHGLGVSYIDSSKMVFALGLIASGVCMYLWLVEFLPAYAAFLGGMLYVFTPYRFVELYVRGDIGENLAFLFLPLTLFFLYRLVTHKKIVYEICASISFAGLMLSHNAMVLMYFPFIIGYCVYLWYISKDRKYVLWNTICAIVLGFILSSFFWIPALLEGKYTLRNFVTAGAYADRFVTFPQLLYSSWNYSVTGLFTKQLGIINWITIIGAIILCFIYWKGKNKEGFLVSGLLLYTFIAIFLMLSQSSVIWQHVTLLQNFQFPWRFLAVPVFSTSVLGAIAVDEVLSSPSVRFRNYLMPVGILGLFILFFNKDYWHANGYFYKSDSFFTAVYQGTTDTGESSPIWSVRFMEKQPKKQIELISGKATILSGKRTIRTHIYIVEASTAATLRDNTIYFPGWEVSEDGTFVPIQYQDPNNRGVITFPVSKGRHTIIVNYNNTKLRTIADIFSSVGLIFALIILFTSFFTKNRSLEYNKHNT